MPDARWPRAFWLAHRGAGKLAPENTLAAFRRGAAHGWRAFECDVKLSADDLPFLLHDATLERTSSGRGIAGQRPWAELSQLDAGSWHGRAYAGEPIPTLEQVSRFIIANGFDLNIEIKPTPGTERHTGEVVGREVLRLWADAPAWPLFSSFRPEALEGARATAPGIARALLLDSLWAGWFETATALGCSGVVTNYTIIDAPTIERLHRAGLFVMVYTVNDPSPAAWLRGIGIDGIITDAVDRFAPSS